jgi:hypothetical protein
VKFLERAWGMEAPVWRPDHRAAQTPWLLL